MVMARCRLMTKGATRVVIMALRRVVVCVMVDRGRAERDRALMPVLDLGTMLDTIHDAGRCRADEHQRQPETEGRDERSRGNDQAGIHVGCLRRRTSLDNPRRAA